jgi:hypothetical protein
MISLLLIFATGCLQFDVEGEVATLSGNLTRQAPRQVQRLLRRHPEVTTIEMWDCPGSTDDQAALEAARMVREAALDTHVPEDGQIASGGVDFFIAGVKRTAHGTAGIGVHSWSESGPGGYEGWELDQDDPEHDMYLDYYIEMGLPSDFYWWTLSVATADEMHWMTREEMLAFGVVTE